MANTFTKNYSDGNALTEAQLDTAFQTVKPDLSNLALSTTGSTSGHVLQSQGSNVTPAYVSLNEVISDTTISSTAADKLINSISSISATKAELIINASTLENLGDITEDDFFGSRTSAGDLTISSVVAVSVTGIYSISVNGSVFIGRDSTSDQLTNGFAVLAPLVNGATVSVGSTTIQGGIGLKLHNVNWGTQGVSLLDRLTGSVSITFYKALTAGDVLGVEVNGTGTDSPTYNTLSTTGTIQACLLRET